MFSTLHQTMNEEIQPSAESYYSAYAQSFRLWSGLRSQARKSPALPTCAISLNDSFPHHPHLQPDTKIDYAQSRQHSRAFASGFSEWGSSASYCQHEIPSLHRPVDITVSVKNPISVCINQSDGRKNYHDSWFSFKNGNYISVLMLGWAYVLSARLSELMSTEASMEYTDSQALASEISGQNSHITISIGACSCQETRWWAAVLAPGRGWQARMVFQGDELLAPWSVSLDKASCFRISSKQYASRGSDPRHAKAASSLEAISFLEKFCDLHRLHDQSAAALAAVLLLPGLHGPQSLTLPAIKTDGAKLGDSPNNIKSASENPQPRHESGGQQYSHRTPQHQDVDRLLTLSCNIRGLKSILLGVFFETSVECNKVGPWIQGALEVIDSLITTEPWVLGRMFMDRLPEAAPLWLGVTVLGLQQKYIKQVRYGQIPVDLNCAIWSGTIQSFIQEPLSSHFNEHARMSRADECRLLFLCQAEGHCRPPICQWAPFGSTAIEHLDIEARLHQDCKGHALQYKGFNWISKVEKSTPERSTLPLKVNSPRHPSLAAYNEVEHIIPPSTEIGLEKEFISEVATQSIFRWLRSEGYAPGEKEIWSHEWLDIPDSDEEEEIEDEEDDNKLEPLAHISRWVEDVEEQGK